MNSRARRAVKRGVRKSPAATSRARGFTLVELLVVVLIILLISAVTLPTVLPALQHRQVTESARILQAALVQARAEAVKANAPRGIRLLPDPTYQNSQTILAYNRWTAIEPGPDYSNGEVVVWPVPTAAEISSGSPAPYVATLPDGSGYHYPYYRPGDQTQIYTNEPAVPGQVLMVEQAPFVGNNTALGLTNPTSWFWNVRIGDKIQINNTGRTYTVIGPMNVANPELFVNDGQPGATPQLQRFYTDAQGNQTPINVEYLYLVNSQDDNQDGFVDEGWDGFNNNYNMNASGVPIIDELLEWQEIEKWTGAEQGVVGSLAPYSQAMLNTTTNLPKPATYTITRRPVPIPQARETSLPVNVVIDATSWTTTQERSRLPIDPKSHFVDILVNPNGAVVMSTEYSSPSSFGSNPSFLHFWLAERQDVHELGDVWGWNNATTPPTPNTNPNAPTAIFQLPMPVDFYSSLTHQPQISLLGERMLVTLFARTGQVTTNSVEFFSATDVNHPFYDSQLGAREAK